MRIAVLGTGVVGQTLAAKLDELGHDVVVGSRDPDAAARRTEPGASGGEAFGSWLEGHAGVSVASFAEAAEGAELVVNATNGSASLAALRAAGSENLDGKVLVDVANPLDFSQGFPPTLLVKDTDSLAEQIQREFPGAKVVKTLNTMNASVMAEPASVAGGDHTTFVCGDDEEAKRVVAGLLAAIGHRDVLDLGDITCARGVEMMLPVWVRLYGVIGGPGFNFKIAR